MYERLSEDEGWAARAQLKGEMGGGRREFDREP